MQRFFKQLASASLLAFFASAAAVHANDISIYPVPYNSLSSSQNPTDPTQTMHIADVDVWDPVGHPDVNVPFEQEVKAHRHAHVLQHHLVGRHREVGVAEHEVANRDWPDRDLSDIDRVQVCLLDV